MDATAGSPWKARIVEDGDFAGWTAFERDSFDDRIGPFYQQKLPHGGVRCGFRAEPRHLNAQRILHGGCLLTFADYCLFAFARQALGGQRGVTVSLNSEFVGAGREGELIEATGEVVKAGRSLVFVRGIVRTAERPLLNFSGLIKRLGSWDAIRPAPGGDAGRAPSRDGGPTEA